MKGKQWLGEGGKDLKVLMAVKDVSMAGRTESVEGNRLLIELGDT